MVQHRSTIAHVADTVSAVVQAKIFICEPLVMVTQPVSAPASSPQLSNGQESAFAAAIESAFEVNNASNRTLPNGVVVVAATTAGSGGTVEAMRVSPDGAGNGAVTQVSVSEEQTGNASDASGGGAAAVVVTTDTTGEQSKTTVVTVTDKNDGSGSQIAIDIPAADGSDTRTTVTIDSSMLETATLPEDARVAFGVLSTDARTGQPGTLILVVPTGTDANGASTFNITTVQMGTTVDPASAFRNYGFSGTIGGRLTNGFGGAVAVEFGGQRQIVWVNAGQNVAPSFTGEIEADYGTIDPSNGGAAGTVAGLVGKITLVFENGRLVGQKDSDGAAISDFNSFIADQIATEPALPEVDDALAVTWQTAVTTKGNLFVIGNANRSNAYSINIREDERDNRVNRNSLNAMEARPASAALEAADR
jgi:hypothetical protein